VKLISHLYVVQRVRIRRAIPPLCCIPLWHVQVQLTVLVQFEGQERLFCMLLHIKARVLYMHLSLSFEHILNFLAQVNNSFLLQKYHLRSVKILKRVLQQ